MQCRNRLMISTIHLLLLAQIDEVLVDILFVVPRGKYAENSLEISFLPFISLSRRSATLDLSISLQLSFITLFCS